MGDNVIQMTNSHCFFLFSGKSFFEGVNVRFRINSISNPITPEYAIFNIIVVVIEISPSLDTGDRRNAESSPLPRTSIRLSRLASDVTVSDIVHNVRLVFTRSMAMYDQCTGAID